MKFNKTTVSMQVSTGEGTNVVEVPGYEYQYALADGGHVRMHVCKHDGDWRVIDPCTGKYLCTGSKTRDDAVKLADSMDVKPTFTNFVKTAKYGKLVAEFDALRGKPEPKAAKPKAPAKPKASEPKADKPKAPKPNAPKPKADEPKADPLDAALKRITELERQVESLKAEKAEPVQEQAATASLDCILKKMQKWCEGKPNVSAYRKNDQPCTPVRVVGETRPYQDELNGMGFRWSPKGFWYMGERELAQLG